MLVTPPPCGHPLYKQRGSLQSTHNKHIKNNPYIELTLFITRHHGMPYSLCRDEDIVAHLIVVNVRERLFERVT